MLPTQQPATDVLRNTVSPFRREGHADKLWLSIDGGQNVSFAPGQYRAQLELYPANAKQGAQPIKIVPHHTGPDPTLAIMELSANELALLRSDSYIRRIILTCPDEAVFVVIDGFLNPQ